MLGGSGIYLKANASPQRVLGKRAARFRKISATPERRRDWKEAMTAITATPKATSLVCCGGDQERRPYGKKTELGFLGHSSEPVLLNYKFLHHQAIAPRRTPHQKQSLPLPTHHPEGGVPGYHSGPPSVVPSPPIASTSPGNGLEMQILGPS